jgi:type I restriction enzyme S subunit
MKQELIQKQKLPSGWNIEPLNKVLILDDGGLWGEEGDVENGVAVLRSTNFNKDMTLNFDNVAYRTIDKEKILKKKLQFEDILLERSGGGPKQPVGRVTLFSKKEGTYLYGNFLQRLRVNKKIALPKYIFYQLYFKYLNGETESLQNNSTNLRNLRYDEFIVLPILLPPLPIQQQIVSKLNKQMAQIEIMKKEAEKERDISKEFFQSFLKKELSDQNEWKKYKIEDLCFLKTGGTPSKSVKEFWNNGNIKWLVSGDVNKEFIYEVEGKITKEGLDNSNAKMLPVNSVLIALNGQGKTRGTVAILKVESTCNQSIVAFIPKERKQLDYLFLFYYLKASYEKLRNLTGDNERSGLSIRILNNYEINVPEINVQREIVKRAEYFNKEQRIINENVNQKLQVIYQLPQSILNETFGKYEIPKGVENEK